MAKSDFPYGTVLTSFRKFLPVQDRQLADAQRKIGELAMDLDIAKALLEEVEDRPRSPRR